MFVPDVGRRVTCSGGCATAWPPLLLRGGKTVVAGPGVRRGLLGTAPDPDGGQVVTRCGPGVTASAGIGTRRGMPNHLSFLADDHLRFAAHGAPADVRTRHER